jgi:hypothetical protein
VQVEHAVDRQRNDAVGVEVFVHVGAVQSERG